MRLIGNPNQLPSGATPPPGQFTKPRSCVVIPNRTTDPEGFIDTGNILPDGTQVIVSVGAARELGRFVGMVSSKEVDDLAAEFEAKFDEAQALIETLKEKVAAAEELERARTLVAASDAEEAVA